MKYARRILTSMAVLATLGVLPSCAANSSGATGANTLEGGVKIPGATTSATTPATTTVHVTLNDTRGLAGPMSISVSPNTAPIGNVKFVVTNTGTIDHEAVVLNTKVAYNKLPITYGGDPPVPVKVGANKVSEDTNIGETGDPNLKPGETRTFTIKNMTAGNYAIVCNIADHYGKGMRALFTIG